MATCSDTSRSRDESAWRPRRWAGAAISGARDTPRTSRSSLQRDSSNPSVVSVQAGHYYQGRLGQQHFGRLRDVGLLPADNSGFEDDVLFANGVGFTDIVKRPTARADGLAPAEYAHGAGTLVAKLERDRPGVVVFTFKKTAELLLETFIGHGEQPSPIAGVRYFVMPGPYAPREEVVRTQGVEADPAEPRRAGAQAGHDLGRSRGSQTQTHQRLAGWPAAATPNSTSSSVVGDNPVALAHEVIVLRYRA